MIFSFYLKYRLFKEKSKGLNKIKLIIKFLLHMVDIYNRRKRNKGKAGLPFKTSPKLAGTGGATEDSRDRARNRAYIKTYDD